MTDNYKFSAILPIYKGVNFHTFKKPFESIINQTLKPNELLVIFDGPIKNNIRKLIEEYQGKYNFIKIINFPSNRGLGYVLNRAVKLCKNKYIARCDADDISIPNRFKIQINYLNKNHKIDVLGSNITEHENDNFFSLKKVEQYDDKIKQKINFRNPINHSSVIFKRNTILQCGNYEDVIFFEDYYLWFKVFKSNGNFYNLQENLVTMKVDNQFYKRRSGFKYYLFYLNFLKKLKYKKYIGIFVFLSNCFMRILIILMPVNFVKYFYKFILRN